MKGLIWIYLSVINIITFIVYGMDKARAIKERWRIPESTLMGLCFAGGSLGAILAMYGFRHKTQKKKFAVGVPLVLVMQILIVASIVDFV